MNDTLPIKGRLSFTPDGWDQAIDCGEAELVLNINFPAKPSYSSGGLIHRGGADIISAPGGNNDYIIPKDFGAQVIQTVKHLDQKAKRSLA